MCGGVSAELTNKKGETFLMVLMVCAMASCSPVEIMLLSASADVEVEGRRK